MKITLRTAIRVLENLKIKLMRAYKESAKMENNKIETVKYQGEQKCKK